MGLACFYIPVAHVCRRILVCPRRVTTAWMCARVDRVVGEISTGTRFRNFVVFQFRNLVENAYVVPGLRGVISPLFRQFVVRVQPFVSTERFRPEDL